MQGSLLTYMEKKMIINSPDAEFYSVNTFCSAHMISRGMLYKLWKQNKGPLISKIGDRTLISKEAAAEWRASLESQTV